MMNNATLIKEFVKEKITKLNKTFFDYALKVVVLLAGIKFLFGPLWQSALVVIIAFYLLYLTTNTLIATILYYIGLPKSPNQNNQTTPSPKKPTK